MIAPGITILFEGGRRTFEPGDLLTAEYRIDSLVPVEIKALEASVMWYTAGKGEEDMAVHHFERLVNEPARPLDLRVPRRFATVMPASPLSYDGVIVKVCWCVRIRVFLSQGQETVTEIPFRFGNVPTGQIEQPIAD